MGGWAGGWKWGGGYPCPLSRSHSEINHQNDKTLRLPIRVSFNVSTIVVKKVTKTVSEDTTVEKTELSEKGPFVLPGHTV